MAGAQRRFKYLLLWDIVKKTNMSSVRQKILGRSGTFDLDFGMVTADIFYVLFFHLSVMLKELLESLRTTPEKSDIPHHAVCQSPSPGGLATDRTHDGGGLPGWQVLPQRVGEWGPSSSTKNGSGQRCFDWPPLPGCFCLKRCWKLKQGRPSSALILDVQEADAIKSRFIHLWENKRTSYTTDSVYFPQHKLLTQLDAMCRLEAKQFCMSKQETNDKETCVYDLFRTEEQLYVEKGIDFSRQSWTVMDCTHSNSIVTETPRLLPENHISQY